MCGVFAIVTLSKIKGTKSARGRGRARIVRRKVSQTRWQLGARVICQC